MHSRSDQVQAHSFMSARLVSALIGGDADAASRPLRRTPIGLAIGLTVAILLVAGFAVFAVVSPGGAIKWREPGALILERETGTRYILVDGKLRPVPNLASARLLLGPRLKMASTPQSSLAGVPRGTPIGIVGAPDALPGKGSARASWIVCASTSTGPGGGPRPELVLNVGGGNGIEPVGDDRAVLVRSDAGTEYLVWQGKRMKLAAGWVAPVLGYDHSRAVPVRDSWLDAVPAGPDLAPPAVPGSGTPGAELDGQRTAVGQVFVVDGIGSPPRYFVRTRDGLLPVNQTLAALAQADPGTTHLPGSSAQPGKLSSAALATTTVLAPQPTMAQLPPQPPALLDGAAGTPCVRSVPGAGTRTSELVAMSTVDRGGVAGGPGLVRDERTADRIEVRPGTGMLARTAPAPGLPAGVYLVAESGAKYPIADEDSAKSLGFELDAAVPVPANLLSLLPTGPLLSAANAGGGGAQAP